MLAEHGLAWFNPDAYARELIAQLGLGLAEANGRAWEHGRSRLEAAIATGANHAFETTLGGSTIQEMLAKATRSHDVSMLFCGLASAELHIRRVQLRVASGGHPIGEDKIRERWVTSRANLVKLLPRLARLQVFDNSAEALPGREIPEPVLVLEMNAGRMVLPDPQNVNALKLTPEWARPIVQAAIEHQGESARKGGAASSKRG